MITLKLKSQSTQMEWAIKFGNTYNEEPIAVKVDSFGYVYTAGWYKGTVDFDPGPATFNLTSPSVAYPNIFISKLDSLGNFIWAKSIASSSGSSISSMTIDQSANIYMVGGFDGVMDFDPSANTYNLTSAGSNVFILKLDSSGNFIWVQQLNDLNTGQLNPYALITDRIGNVYTTGYFSDTIDFSIDEKFHMVKSETI